MLHENLGPRWGDRAVSCGPLWQITPWLAIVVGMPVIMAVTTSAPGQFRLPAAVTTDPQPETRVPQAHRAQRRQAPPLHRSETPGRPQLRPPPCGRGVQPVPSTTSGARRPRSASSEGLDLCRKQRNWRLITRSRTFLKSRNKRPYFGTCFNVPSKGDAEQSWTAAGSQATKATSRPRLERVVTTACFVTTMRRRRCQEVSNLRHA